MSGSTKAFKNRAQENRPEENEQGSSDAPWQRSPTTSAAGTTVDRLSVHYEDVKAVEDVSIEIQRGEFLALLGPSGSGKTTVLMSIAGFTEITSGDIRIADTSIVNMPPEQRGLGVVFQGYALFPHLSVEANVAFPLEMAGTDRTEAHERVHKSLATAGLKGLGRRYPSELSGGQQQRVALARALVFDPPLLLLDEPLGSLDKQLRASMQREFRTLHKEVGTTIVYVTHDQQEALAMADRIAVMEDGHIIQLGTPLEVFNDPRSQFVAEFIGDCNFVPITLAERQGDRYIVEVQGYKGELDQSRVRAQERASTLAVRPHHVFFFASDSENGVPAYVADVIFLGEITEYVLELADGSNFRVRHMTHEGDRIARADRVRVGWEWNRASAF